MVPELLFHSLRPGKAYATLEQTPGPGDGAGHVGVRTGRVQTKEQGRGPETWSELAGSGDREAGTGSEKMAVGVGARCRPRGALSHPKALDDLPRVTRSRWRVLSRRTPSDLRPEAPSGCWVNRPERARLEAGT